ncbi:hypothetical protein L615_001600000530 [Nocardioides sp. J9]|nr:hypothetical protein L615_001600000530 [Nocardioides sp. J9]
MVTATAGWIGTVGSLCAYLLLTSGRWRANSLRYAALNFGAAVLAGAASAAYGAWPSAAANVVWAAVSLHSYVSVTRARRSESRRSANRTSVPEFSDAAGPEPQGLRAA